MKSTKKIILLLFLFIFVQLSYSSNNLIAAEYKILHNDNIVQVQTTDDDGDSLPTTEETEPSPIEEDPSLEEAPPVVNPEENGEGDPSHSDENEGYNDNDQYLDEDSY